MSFSSQPNLRHKASNHMNNRKALEEYVKASISPDTAERWKIALSNPESPVFKLFWSLVTERAINTKILEILLDRLADTAYQEKQREIEQMLKDEISRAELMDKRFRAHEQKMVKFIHDNLDDASLKDLKKLALELPIKIEKLEKKSEKLKVLIAQKATAIKVAQQVIQAEQAVLVTQFVQNMPQFVSVKTGQPIVISAAEAASLGTKLTESGRLDRLLDINTQFSHFVNETPAEPAQDMIVSRINLHSLIHASYVINKADGLESITGKFVTKNKKQLGTIPQITKESKAYMAVGEVLKLHKERSAAKDSLKINEEKRVLNMALFQEINDMIHIKSNTNQFQQD